MKPTSAMSGKDCSFATGRIAVLQQRLLSLADVDRLIGAHQASDLPRIFQDVKFTSAVMHDVSSIDEIVARMEQWLRTELESMLPSHYHDALNILWLREDAPLIAGLLKQHFGFAPKKPLDVRSPSAHDPKLLEALILRDETDEAIPEHLSLFVHKQKTKPNQTPSLIDASVSRYVARTQTELAKASGSALLIAYVRHLIDLQNLRIATRMQETDDAAKHLLPGGEADVAKLIGDKKNAIAALRGTSLHRSIMNEFERASSSTIAIERGLVKGLAHDIAAMRSNLLGFESAFAFAIIALSQLRIIHTVIIGKNAGLSPAEIRDILPPLLSTSPNLA